MSNFIVCLVTLVALMLKEIVRFYFRLVRNLYRIILTGFLIMFSLPHYVFIHRLVVLGYKLHNA